MVRYGDISLPIGYEIVRKEIQYCDVKTKKERRKSGTTKNELLREIIKQSCANKVLFKYILADNWWKCNN